MFLLYITSTLGSDSSTSKSQLFNTYQMKYIIASIGFCFLVHFQVQAQGWVITPYNGFAHDVETASTGDFYVAGVEEGTAIVFKLDTAGNLMWKKELLERRVTKISLLQGDDLAMATITKSALVPTDTLTSIRIFRLNPAGETLWSKEFNFFFGEEIYEIIETSSNELLIFGKFTKGILTNRDKFDFIMKLDRDGNLIFKKDYDEWQYSAAGTVELSSGDFLTIRVGNNSDIVRLNGAMGWEEDFLFNPRFNDGNPFIYPMLIVPSDNGDITLLQEGVQTEVYYTRINSQGDVLKHNTFPFGDGFADSSQGVKTTDGNYGIGGVSFLFNGGVLSQDFSLLKLDADGNELWHKQYRQDTIGGHFDEVFMAIAATNDGGFIMVGGGGNGRAFLVKTDADGNVFPNFVRGKLFLEENEDCIWDEPEEGLSGWTIQAEGPKGLFYTRTDEAGEYELSLPLGEYAVRAIPPSAYWANSCENEYQVNITATDSILQIPLPVSPVVDCPLIEVDVSTNRLRRCFPSTFLVNYCNKGTTAGEDIYIDLTLDEYLTIDSSLISYTPIGNHVYRFPIGTIEMGDCGQFSVHTTLACDLSIPLGQVHCVEAHAFPDSLCLPPNQNWDGSSIDVSASCRSDTVFFRIGNFGEGSMSAPLNYIVIEDQIILHEKSFQLAQGSYLIDTIVGFGDRRYTLVAQQSEGSPGSAFPNSTMVNCVASSLGLSVDLPADSGSPFRDIHCQENIDSYDPNDKRGWPIGFGEEQIIFPNTEIEYMIRFQNTGTDTAYKVVISDPLPATLDITSLSLGASSHPYTWSIEENNSLIFTFDNILLPDSTTNLEASQGFVSFTLQQQADLALGTTIMNTAAIYFDFNDPIYTNTSRHKVGTLFSQALVATQDLNTSNLGVKIYPNPFNETTSFRIEKVKSQAVRLHLYDLSGRLIRIADYATTSFQFDRAGLADGLYTYQLILADGSRGHGKIAIVD